MKNIYLFLLMVALVACSRHDPILPGVRHDIFDVSDVVVQNKEVPDLSNAEKNISGDKICNYRQDSSNTIWSGDKKMFSGFAQSNVVKSNQSPVCAGQFIYTGFTTGEVVKIDMSKQRQIWATDVFRLNNLTGGASVVDIIAHVGIDGKYVYAGGLGDAFCKLNAQNGAKIWCINISVPVDFIIVDDVAFVVGTDDNLYAVNTINGSVYWKTAIKEQTKPEFNGKYIIVGNQNINYKNGNLI